MELWVRVDTHSEPPGPHTPLLQELGVLNLTCMIMSTLLVYPVLPLDHHTRVPLPKTDFSPFSKETEGI